MTFFAFPTKTTLKSDFLQLADNMEGNGCKYAQESVEWTRLRAFSERSTGLSSLFLPSTGLSSLFLPFAYCRDLPPVPLRAGSGVHFYRPILLWQAPLSNTLPNVGSRGGMLHRTIVSISFETVECLKLFFLPAIVYELWLLQIYPFRIFK